eukprot:359203_1
MGNKPSKKKGAKISSPVMNQPIGQKNVEKPKPKNKNKQKTEAETYNYAAYKSPIQRQQEILGITNDTEHDYSEYNTQRRPKIHSTMHEFGNNNIVYQKPATIYPSKNVIESKFDSSRSETWNKEHSIALNDICLLISVPEVICGIIESYVWTSAVIINKIYLPNLTETFAKCTKGTRKGRHYTDPLNIAIFGANKSGKTNLVSRFYVNAFIKTDDKSQTDVTKCICLIDNITYNLRVTDTGTGFYSLMTEFKKNIVREADCIMLVFDVNNIKSYEWISAHGMIQEFMRLKYIGNERDIPIVIVGAKIDQIDNNIDDEKRKGRNQFFDVEVERLIGVEMIKKNYCVPYNTPYIEVSAKCCVNIDHLFQMAVKEAMTYVCNFK